MKNYELAKLAYDAYCKKRDWKSIKGEPLPHFEQQSLELQDAWWEAAQAVHMEGLNQSSPG